MGTVEKSFWREVFRKMKNADPPIKMTPNPIRMKGKVFKGCVKGLDSSMSPISIPLRNEYLCVKQNGMPSIPFLAHELIYAYLWHQITLSGRSAYEKSYDEVSTQNDENRRPKVFRQTSGWRSE